MKQNEKRIRHSPDSFCRIRQERLSFDATDASAISYRIRIVKLSMRVKVLSFSEEP